MPDHVVEVNGKFYCRYCGEEITTQALCDLHEDCERKQKDKENGKPEKIF